MVDSRGVKPLWQEIHDGEVDDIITTIEDIKIMKEWIIQATNGICANSKQDFLDTLNMLEKKLKRQRREYKEKYGFYPRRSTLKEIFDNR